MAIVLIKQGGMELYPPAFAAAETFLSIGSDYSDCNGYIDLSCFHSLFSMLKTPQFFFSHFGTVFPGRVKPDT
jgi:hypothetical protein